MDEYLPPTPAHRTVVLEVVRNLPSLLRPILFHPGCALYGSWVSKRCFKDTYYDTGCQDIDLVVTEEAWRWWQLWCSDVSEIKVKPEALLDRLARNPRHKRALEHHCGTVRKFHVSFNHDNQLLCTVKHRRWLRVDVTVIEKPSGLFKFLTELTQPLYLCYGWYMHQFRVRHRTFADWHPAHKGSHEWCMPHPKFWKYAGTQPLCGLAWRLCKVGYDTTDDVVPVTLITWTRRSQIWRRCCEAVQAVIDVRPSTKRPASMYWNYAPGLRRWWALALLQVCGDLDVSTVRLISLYWQPCRAIDADVLAYNNRRSSPGCAFYCCCDKPSHWHHVREFLQRPSDFRFDEYEADKHLTDEARRLVADAKNEAFRFYQLARSVDRNG